MKYIKRYEQINEGIKHLLNGPSENEIMDNFKNDPNKLFKIGCETNNLDFVKQSLDSVTDNVLYEGLLSASEDNYSDIIKYIINNHNIDVNKINTIVIYSIMNDDLELLKMFIELGFNINDNSMLHVSSGHKKYDITKYLLDFGLDVNCDNNLPLQLAVQSLLYGNNKSPDVVRLLLKYGAIPNDETMKISSNNKILSLLFDKYKK